LAVPKDRLEEKIQAEPLFGFRFYKALALFLADRLRHSHLMRAQAGGKSSPSAAYVEADEIDEKVLDTVSIAGDRFDRLVKAVNAGGGEALGR
jgi:CRP/FNR family transcriptional regulator, cyclic AMP receptor protein